MNTSAFHSALPDTAFQAEAIAQLDAHYPVLRSFRLGQSLCGRPITLLKIGQESDDRGGVLFAGAFHGMEWLTGLLLLRFADRLCHAITTKQRLAGIYPGHALEGRTLSIIPFVNPDGVEISLFGKERGAPYDALIDRAGGGHTDRWQANARGVDINHNFDAGWHTLREMEKSKGIDGAASTQYGGPGPESEPESRLLADHCRQTYYRHVLAFHSQGEEIYWHYGARTHQSAHLMGRILAVASGYKLCMPTGLASHGGFKDWFIEEFGRPAFTVELGKGRNPLPLSDLDSVYNRVEEMLMIASLL